MNLTPAGAHGGSRATLFADGSVISNTMGLQDPENSGFETAQAAHDAFEGACADLTPYDR